MRSVPDGYKELASTLLFRATRSPAADHPGKDAERRCAGPPLSTPEAQAVSRAAMKDGRLLKDAATSTLAQAPERRNWDIVPGGNRPHGRSYEQAAWLNLPIR